MSVEESGVVDAVGIETASGKIVLTISDHLDWSDADDHEFKLQEKLNAYLRFVESEEIFESYPKARGRVVVIDVVLRVAPSPRGQEFFETVRPILAGAGLELRARVLPQA